MSTPEIATSEIRRRPGGRSERIRTAVLEAALSQLALHGYDGLSIAAVAREAGVAETTVYRRWPTPAVLAAAAVAHLAHTDNPIPDTGSLEEDLRALLAQVAELLARPGTEQILRAAAALDRNHPDAARARTAFWDSRFTGSQVIVERAVRRTELAEDSDPYAVIECLVAPLYFRVLLTDRSIDTDFLEDCVQRTLRAFGGLSAR